jgi:hypothetical protein
VDAWLEAAATGGSMPAYARKRSVYDDPYGRSKKPRISGPQSIDPAKAAAAAKRAEKCVLVFCLCRLRLMCTGQS